MKKTLTDEPKRAWTEEEAIQRAQEGDAAAFEYIYVRHSKGVYSLCLRMLRNPSDAEDLTQHIFLRVFRKIGTFRGDSAFSTWLHRVTVNAVLMHLRRRGPIEIHPGSSNSPATDFETAEEVGGTDTSMLGAVERLNLKRAIHKLPLGNKRLFVLHEVMGYRHSEIAELVGCSIASSKSQVHRARKKLQDLLYGEREEAEHDVAPA